MKRVKTLKEWQYTTHLARMDAKNGNTRFGTGRWELDLTIDSAGTQKRAVQNVDTVGSHDHLK